MLEGWGYSLNMREGVGWSFSDMLWVDPEPEGSFYLGRALRLTFRL